MIEFGLSLLIVLLLITAMAIGVIMGRKPISGSCGGVGAALGETDYSCDLCGGDPNKCDSQESMNNTEYQNEDLACDVTRASGKQ